MSLVVVFLLSDALADEAWSVLVEKPTYRILRQSHTHGHAFRLESELKASAADAFEAFRSLTFDPAYNAEQGHDFEILDRDDDGVLLYSYMDAPWPFRDRDVTLRYTIANEAPWVLRWREVAERPARPRVVRMPTDRGEWVFTDLDAGRCSVVATLRFDPGGRIPDWMVTMQVRQVLPSDLRAIGDVLDREGSADLTP